MADETQSTNTDPAIPLNQVGANSEIQQIADDLTTLIQTVVDGFTSGTAKDIDGNIVDVKVKNSENAKLAEVALSLKDNRVGKSPSEIVTYDEILNEVKNIVKSAKIVSTTDGDLVFNSSVKSYLDSLENRVINRLIGAPDSEDAGVTELYNTLKELNDLISSGDKNTLQDFVLKLNTFASTAKAQAETAQANAESFATTKIGELKDSLAKTQKATDDLIDANKTAIEANKTAIDANKTAIEANKAAIEAEVTARTNAISTEESNRNTAISNAIEALEKRLGTAKQFELAKEKITKFSPFKK